MPRQSSRRPAASHSSSRPSLFGGSSQSRSASTMAAPSYRAPAPSAAVHTPANPATPAAAPQQPGMFAQMATTAAGVAVGSAVGHTLGAGLTGLFSGSSNDAPAQQQQQQQLSAAPAQSYNQQQSQICDADARNFTKCLEDSDGNYQACDFYLQQLKACQAAAKQY